MNNIRSFIYLFTSLYLSTWTCTCLTEMCFSFCCHTAAEGLIQANCNASLIIAYSTYFIVTSALVNIDLNISIDLGYDLWPWSWPWEMSSVQYILLHKHENMQSTKLGQVLAQRAEGCEFEFHPGPKLSSLGIWKLYNQMRNKSVC